MYFTISDVFGKVGFFGKNDQFRAGVSNSNVFKGHILRKHGLATRKKQKTCLWGPHFLKICLKTSHFWIFSYFHLHRGPHRSCWRGTCGPQNASLRPLILSLNQSQRTFSGHQIFQLFHWCLILSGYLNYTFLFFSVNKRLLMPFVLKFFSSRFMF